MFAPKSVSRGLRDRMVEYTTWVLGIQYLLNLSFATENFEPKASQVYSFPATPGKPCLRPKVSLGGLRDRTVEYIT